MFGILHILYWYLISGIVKSSFFDDSFNRTNISVKKCEFPAAHWQSGRAAWIERAAEAMDVARKRLSPNTGNVTAISQ
ncbi:hypothetical protein [Burkholderia singularis]|uniref:hypothetical protein n=1 Tax=Burkholderia singularis TaxID=1503053 RepID=UPI001180BE38|nr:hypothetical protein [Burkholderia singularis]